MGAINGGWELAVKVLDIAVLLDFFENGNPHPGRARPEALTFGTIPGLIFTFREKEFLFYDFFWVWGFSLLEGARVYFYGLVLGLWLCVSRFCLFLCFQLLLSQQNNVVLSCLVCQLLNEFLWPVFQ